MTAFGVVVLCFYSVLFINAVSKANIVPQSEKEQSTNETDNEEQTGIDEEKRTAMIYFEVHTRMKRYRQILKIK